MQPVQKWIRAKLRRLVPIVMAFGLVTSWTVAATVVTSTPASAGTDTYPSKWKDIPQDSVFDDWGEYNRECTSYVAWMLHSVNGFDMPFHDNATGWASDATARGYTVDTTPAAGAVGWMSIGHVAWIESVNSDGTVNAEDYNYSYDGTYAEHLNQSAGTYQKYIHFKDLSSSPPPPPGSASHADLAWYSGTTLYSFTGSGLGTNAAETYSAPGWAGVGDYNHDGTDDVFWYDPNSTTIYAILGPSFTYAQPVRGPGVGAPTWAAVGDFTGDGFADSIAWYSGSTLYTFTGSCLCTTGAVSGYSAPIWAAVGDYNRNGTDGLFWYSGSTIYFLGSNGSAVGALGAGAIRGPGVGAPTWAAVGDFDGDGYRNDLAWYDGTTLYTFEGSGLGTTGQIAGYSPPDWAGVGRCAGGNRDGLFWYLGGTSETIYCIGDNGTSFTGATAMRGPGVGAPSWAGSGNF